MYTVDERWDAIVQFTFIFIIDLKFKHLAYGG